MRRGGRLQDGWMCFIHMSALPEDGKVPQRASGSPTLIYPPPLFLCCSFPGTGPPAPSGPITELWPPMADKAQPAASSPRASSSCTFLSPGSSLHIVLLLNVVLSGTLLIELLSNPLSFEAPHQTFSAHFQPPSRVPPPPSCS